MNQVKSETTPENPALSFCLNSDQRLEIKNSKWLVTGAAGFIGSHLVEGLLQLGASVVGLDNLSSGYLANLDVVRSRLPESAWDRWTWMQANLLDDTALKQSLDGVQYVLHHAAIGSVPRSMADPVETQVNNVLGFQKVLAAASKAKVKRVVYASSSAVFGDNTVEPKQEKDVGRPLSPYALSKYMNELDAELYSRLFGLSGVGLRYFNVFGPRQDPNGAYAAVIPKFFQSMNQGAPCEIYGDGETTRDFCFVKNIVQANLLAAIANLQSDYPSVFNIATGTPVSLKDLHQIMRQEVQGFRSELSATPPVFKDFRAGDIQRSSANIEAAKKFLGYEPQFDLRRGIREAMNWYCG